MFRIRKILDSTTSANQFAIDQVLKILTQQFPAARKEDFTKLTKQLDNPLKYKYRSILIVAENGMGKIRGFAMLLHFPDIKIGYLELISTAPEKTGGGIGGALYEAVRDECHSLTLKGLFFECLIDDPAFIYDEVLLKQNKARLKFYEQYDAYPIINNVYAEPVIKGDQELYYLVVDKLDKDLSITKSMGQKVVRAILERKYADLISPEQITSVVESFQDNPLTLRAPM